MSLVTVELPNNTEFHNIYDLSGIPDGTSVILTNNTNSPVFLVQSPTQPAVSSDAYPVVPGETVVIHYNDDPIWAISDASGSPIVLQQLTGTITPFTSIELPQGLYTSKKEGFRRLRVDVAQTGFFEGREFRTFYRLNIPTASEIIVRVTTPINLILFSLTANIKQGDLEIIPVVGGTPGGTFSTPLPIIGANAMSTRPSPFYAPVATIATGGTLTGGTEIDVLLVKAAGNSNFAATIGSNRQDERGVAAGTYYYRIKNVGADTVLGVLNARWEERPEGY